MGRNIEQSLYSYCMEHPEAMHLLEQYSSLNPVRPDQIGSKTSQRVHWYCSKCDYHWDETVVARVKYPAAPCCSGRHVTSINNFAAQFPELLKDWDYSKNTEDPTKIKSQKHIRVNWKCHKCGNEWNTELKSRVHGVMRYGASRCPKCSSKQCSFAERIVYEYLKQYFPDTRYRYKETGVEFDAFIPSLSLAIEYDGIAWHSSDNALEKHTRKLENAISNNIKLVNIVEYIIDKEVPFDRYTDRHYLIPFGTTSTYDIAQPLIRLIADFMYSTYNFSMQPVTNEFIQNIKNEIMNNSIIDNSLLEDKPWIKYWYSASNEVGADKISKGSTNEIILQCPNCGRQRKIKAHWIGKQFTGCSACKCRDYIPEEHLLKIKKMNAEAYQRRKDKLKEQRQNKG